MCGKAHEACENKGNSGIREVVSKERNSYNYAKRYFSRKFCTNKIFRYMSFLGVSNNISSALGMSEQSYLCDYCLGAT